MLIPVSIILSSGFVGWLIWRAVKKKPIKVHLVMYGLSVLTGILSIVFFMTMDLPTIAKVIGAIALGGVLIFLAARMQRRSQADKTSSQ
jgi:tryptophan-rich sensory protein